MKTVTNTHHTSTSNSVKRNIHYRIGPYMYVIFYQMISNLFVKCWKIYHKEKNKIFSIPKLS